MDIDLREPVRLGESTQWIRIRAANAIRGTYSPYAATAIVLSAGVRRCGAGWCAGPGAVYDL